jgi:hypothetical protein
MSRTNNVGARNASIQSFPPPSSVFQGTSAIINGTNSPFYRGYNYLNTSNKATFLDPISANLSQPISQSNPAKKGQSSTFSISYHDAAGSVSMYLFSLMPAIENILRGNNNGLSVPEVKPGLSFRTDINTKKMSIPGGPPAFQSLGINQTILQITAALIGNEQIINPKETNNRELINRTTTNASNQLYLNTGAYGANVSRKFNALNSALRLDTEVVQQGRPVIFNIHSDVSNTDDKSSLNVRCLVQSLRLLSRYIDRCYVSFDLVLLDYLNKDMLTTKFIGGFKK